MGTVRDNDRRESKARKDTPVRRSNLNMVRGWIYGKARAVKSAAVERIMGPQSWVPTVVCVIYCSLLLCIL